MRYFYIICLTLSSLFIYNQSSADNLSFRYAFFVPNQAYQGNTAVNNLDSIKPRYKKNKTNEKFSKPSFEKKSRVTTKTSEKITPPTVKKAQTKVSDTPPIKETPTITETAISRNTKTPPITPDTDSAEIKSISEALDDKTKQLSKEDEEKIKEIAAQYNIEEDDFIISPEFSNKPNQPKEKTISTMLSEIPYPNPDEPNFKQTFGKYGITLRTLYRQKKMPKDYEQDKILAKANSIKRFKVEASD